MIEFHHNGKRVEPKGLIQHLIYAFCAIVAGSIALIVGSFNGSLDLTKGRERKLDENWFPYDEDAFPDFGGRGEGVDEQIRF